MGGGGVHTKKTRRGGREKNKKVVCGLRRCLSPPPTPYPGLVSSVPPLLAPAGGTLSGLSASLRGNILFYFTHSLLNAVRAKMEVARGEREQNLKKRVGGAK